jgi:hypothetical protein
VLWLATNLVDVPAEISDHAQRFVQRLDWPDRPRAPRRAANPGAAGAGEASGHARLGRAHQASRLQAGSERIEVRAAGTKPVNGFEPIPRC